MPIFRAIPEVGLDIECPHCDGVVLAAGVGRNRVFDVDVVCASCGLATPLPSFPSGRGLGGVVRRVRSDHHFTGTFVLETDEIVVGPRAVRQRARETGIGGRRPELTERVLDVAGIEEVVERARSTLGPVLDALRDRGRSPTHPLPRLISRLEDNVDELRAGGRVVDLRAVMSLERATAVFAAWSKDPSASKLLQESTHPEGFDHNAALLQIASMLEAAGLGPELVPPKGGGRTADLALRLSASRVIDLDVKTPQALRYRPDEVFKFVDPRRTIRKALRASRGQFGFDGILVVAGEVWIGGVEGYATTRDHLRFHRLRGDQSGLPSEVVHAVGAQSAVRRRYGIQAAE